MEVYNYSNWRFTISDDSYSLADAVTNGVFFTVKSIYTDADSAAILQVQEGVGLLYVNGVAATAGDGSLTVIGSENGITVNIKATVTGFTADKPYTWEIKKVITEDEEAIIVDQGTFVINNSIMQGLSAA